MTVIFAIPRHEYASYRDLYTLIDLSGFQTCFIDEIDPQSDNAYVITILNGEVPEVGYPNARAQIVLYDLEYHLNGVPPLAGVTYWAADKWYSERIGAKYVPMGSHVGLVPEYHNFSYAQPLLHEDPRRYDVAFIGYFDGVPRRQVIRQQLIEHGVRVSPTGGWGSDRDALLMNSRAYLCVHQLADAPTIAPLRMVVAAAYSLPVISEAVADAGVFTEEVLLQQTYETLLFLVRDVLQLIDHHDHAYTGYLGIGDWFHTRGEALHQFLCHDLTFRKSVEAGL